MAYTARWVYKDSFGSIRGPFSGYEMHNWFMHGHFCSHPELLIKKVDDAEFDTFGTFNLGEFETLEQLVRRIGLNHSPFLELPEGFPCQLSRPINGFQLAFANEMPGFGTSLTVQQNDALERHIQEEESLMARQRGHLAMQNQLLAQLGMAGSSRGGLQQLDHQGSGQSTMQKEHLENQQQENNALPSSGSLRENSLGSRSLHTSLTGSDAPPSVSKRHLYPCTVFNVESLYTRAKEYGEILNDPLYVVEEIHNLNHKLKEILEDEKLAAALTTELMSQKPVIDVGFLLPQSQELIWSTYEGNAQRTRYYQHLVQVRDGLTTLFYCVEEFAMKFQMTGTFDVSCLWELHSVEEADNELEWILKLRYSDPDMSSHSAPAGPSPNSQTPSEALEARLDAHANAPAPAAGSFISKDKGTQLKMKSVGRRNGCEDSGHVEFLKTRQQALASILSPESDDQPPPMPNHATKPVEIARTNGTTHDKQRQYTSRELHVDHAIAQPQKQIDRGSMEPMDEKKALSFFSRWNRKKMRFDPQPQPCHHGFNEAPKTAEPLHKRPLHPLPEEEELEAFRIKANIRPSITDDDSLQPHFQQQAEMWNTQNQPSMAEQESMAKDDKSNDAEADEKEVRSSKPKNDHDNDSTDRTAHSKEKQKETCEAIRTAKEVKSHPEVSLNFGPEVPFAASEASTVKELPLKRRNAISTYLNRKDSEDDPEAENVALASKNSAAPKTMSASRTGPGASNAQRQSLPATPIAALASTTIPPSPAVGPGIDLNKKPKVLHPDVELSDFASRPKDIDTISVQGACRSREQQILGETLYKKVYQLQPQLAGKITGMLIELTNAQIVRLIKDAAYLHRKVAEAYGVYEEYVKSNRSTKENLRQTLFPMINDQLNLGSALAHVVTDVVLEMDDAAVFDLIIDEAALRKKIDEVAELHHREGLIRDGADPLESATPLGAMDSDEDYEDEHCESDQGDDEALEASDAPPSEADEDYSEDDRSDEQNLLEDEGCSDETEEHFYQQEDHVAVCESSCYEFPELTPEVIRRMDQETFPKSVLSSICIGTEIPFCINTWWKLKDYTVKHCDIREIEDKRRQVLSLQAECYVQQWEQEQQQVFAHQHQSIPYQSPAVDEEESTDDEDATEHPEDVVPAQKDIHEHNPRDGIDPQPTEDPKYHGDMVDAMSAIWQRKAKLETATTLPSATRKPDDLQIPSPPVSPCQELDWDQIQTTYYEDDFERELEYQKERTGLGTQPLPSEVSNGCFQLPIGRSRSPESDGSGPVDMFNDRDLSTASGDSRVVKPVGGSKSSPRLSIPSPIRTQTRPHGSVPTTLQPECLYHECRYHHTASAEISHILLMPENTQSLHFPGSQTLFVKRTIESRRRQLGQTLDLVVCPLTDEEKQFLKPLQEDFLRSRVKPRVESTMIARAAVPAQPQPQMLPTTRPVSVHGIRGGNSRISPAKDGENATIPIAAPTPATIPASLMSLHTPPFHGFNDIDEYFPHLSRPFSPPNPSTFSERGNVTDNDPFSAEVSADSTISGIPIPVPPFTTTPPPHLHVYGSDSIYFDIAPAGGRTSGSPTDLQFSWTDERKKLDVPIVPDFNFGTDQVLESKLDTIHDRTPSVNFDFKFPDPKPQSANQQIQFTEPLSTDSTLKSIDPHLDSAAKIVDDASMPRSTTMTLDTSDAGSTSGDVEDAGGEEESECLKWPSIVIPESLYQPEVSSIEDSDELVIQGSDTGRSDTGRSDTGRSDTGRSDTRRSDAGRSDAGQSDAGQSDSEWEIMNGVEIMNDEKELKESEGSKKGWFGWAFGR